MKKLLLGLGSVTSIMPIAAIIACGTSAEEPKTKQTPKKQPKETPKPKSSEDDQKTSVGYAISDDLKKALEKTIFNSTEDKIELSNLPTGIDKTWSEVKNNLGISLPIKKDGNPSFSEKNLNSKDIKISFFKIEDSSKKLGNFDKEVTIEIKKNGSTTAMVILHLASVKISSNIELSKVIDQIYYWDNAPKILTSKTKNTSVTLSELGISKEYLTKPHLGLLDSSTDVTFEVKTPLNNETNEITLITKVNYNNTKEKTKEITIRYSYLTFGAVKNATAKIANGILDISKDSSKSDSWAKIAKLSWEKDSYKKLFKNYFDNSKDSFKEVYYMIKFMLAATNDSNITIGTMGVVSKKGDKTLTLSDKYSLLENKIFNSKFDIQETAQGIISKFLGDDPDLNYSIVQLGGTVNKNDKILNKGDMWDSASSSMGGDETVKYIISKIGYTLV